MSRDIQVLVEETAALRLGRNIVALPHADVILVRRGKQIRRDKKHYLWLRFPDDLGSWIGCGSASQAVQYIVVNKRWVRLCETPQSECPNCREDAHA